MKIKIGVVIILVTLMIIILCSSVDAREFTGADGTPAATPEEYETIRLKNNAAVERSLNWGSIFEVNPFIFWGSVVLVVILLALIIFFFIPKKPL